LVKICHRRGAHAIGGMSAFIPSKNESVNERAFAQVKADKEREVNQGYDGTWVAHPRLVEVAKKVFDAKLGQRDHQKDRLCEEIAITRHDLLAVETVPRYISEKGFRANINVALMYIESWLRGIGAAALYNLMEDAATAEISRAQLWQWLHHKNIFLEDGREVTIGLYNQFRDEEYAKVREDLMAVTRDHHRISQARDILDALVLNEKFEDFLTTGAYNYLP
jgi:malate synthase